MAGEQSGHSVSSAGDVNGDGLMDIILGAPNNSIDGSANTGQSYVVYGKTSTSNVNLSDIVNNIGGFAIVGEGGEDLSGYSVGAAGDVNGDGLADLIVGAPGYDAAHGDVQTGRSYIILGAKTGAFKAGSFVDDIGTSGNDTVASTGSQTLAGGTGGGAGNDTFTSNGADVLLGGKGADIFILNQSTITALQNVFGAGGNTAQLARIDGGSGIDTIRLGGTGALDLNLSLVKNIGVGHIEGMSRINSIEYIDMRTDTYSNKLTIRVDDVLDMAGSNWINATLSDFVGEGSWRNKSSGTTMDQTVWRYHQIVVDGTNQDTVSTTGWTLQTTGALSGWKAGDTVARTYNVYIATDGRPAMMMVEQPIVPSTVL